MANKYWENEKPDIIQTEKNFFIHYPEAGKLQICGSFRDNKGEIVPGKRGTIDIEDLATHPEAIEILQKFIDEAKDLEVKTE